MGAMASQITSLTILYSTVYSGTLRSQKTSTLRVTEPLFLRQTRNTLYIDFVNLYHSEASWCTYALVNGPSLFMMVACHPLGAKCCKWISMNKLSRQWTYAMTFIQENEFENVVYKMSAILLKPPCVAGKTVLINKFCPRGLAAILNYSFSNWYQRYLQYFLWNYPQVSATKPRWWLVNIVTRATVDTNLCRHMASQDHNELNHVLP